MNQAPEMSQDKTRKIGLISSLSLHPPNGSISHLLTPTSGDKKGILETRTDIYYLQLGIGKEVKTNSFFKKSKSIK